MQRMTLDTEDYVSPVCLPGETADQHRARLKELGFNCLFIANCEYSQAVADPSIGDAGIQVLVAKEFEAGFIDGEVAKLQSDDKFRKKCYMQLLCGEALKHGSALSFR